ncbi:MAG: helix-turn-helix domain-containing protein [Micromonosporaceae bacterium]
MSAELSASPDKRLTIADLDTLPIVVDLPTAAVILGIGRIKAYQLAQSGEFPCRVLRLGRSYRVPVPALLDLLRPPAE